MDRSRAFPRRGHLRAPPVRALLLAAVLTTAAEAADVHVAVNGSDSTGDGSIANPWATIDFAIDQVSGGDRILVGPGTYTGRSRLDREFDPPVTIRAEPRYQAKLQYAGGAAIVVFTGRNIIVEGFEITHAPGNTGALVVQVQDLLGAVSGSADGTDPVVSGIVFRDNIIHTSTNNDLLKVNNGAEDVLIQGNLFYDQSGSDEHKGTSVPLCAERDGTFAGSPGVASTTEVWSFQTSESKRAGWPAKDRPCGFCRERRISRVAILGRGDGHCHSSRSTRSAAFPTETRFAQRGTEVPGTSTA